MGDYEMVCALSGAALPHGAPCFWARTATGDTPLPTSLLWPGRADAYGCVTLDAETAARVYNHPLDYDPPLPDRIQRNMDGAGLLAIHPEAVARAARLTDAAARVGRVREAARERAAALRFSTDADTIAVREWEKVWLGMRAHMGDRSYDYGFAKVALGYVPRHILTADPEVFAAIWRLCAVCSVGRALHSAGGFPFFDCTKNSGYPEDDAARREMIRVILSVGAGEGA